MSVGSIGPSLMWMNWLYEQQHEQQQQRVEACRPEAKNGNRTESSWRERSSETSEHVGHFSGLVGGLLAGINHVLN